MGSSIEFNRSLQRMEQAIEQASTVALSAVHPPTGAVVGSWSIGLKSS